MLCRHPRHERSDTHDVHDAGQIVGQDVQPAEIHPLPTSAGGPSPRVPPLWIRNIPRRTPGLPAAARTQSDAPGARCEDSRVGDSCLPIYAATYIMPQAYPSCRQPKQTQCAEAGGEEREHG